MAETVKVQGWPSFKLAGKTVEAYVTEEGGHCAPVVYDRAGRKIQPFYVAPWAGESWPDQPVLLRALRGDFFCMPFGGNETPFRGEKHPPHGETANGRWRLVERTSSGPERALEMEMRTTVRKGTVRKTIRLVDGHHAVYSRHVMTGYSGPMDFGHHAILRFPDRERSGLLSFSRFIKGSTAPLPVENPAARGYSILEPGAAFSRLDRVRTITGATTDLSSYPARRGFEDIALLAADPDLPFAWSAASVPSERYVWFSLKDPRRLAVTLLWMSNGGRHYPPWNGRNVNTLGIEEVTGFFHYGLAPSAARNDLSRAGIPTCATLSPRTPTAVSTVMGCVAVPAAFGRVRKIAVGRSRETAVLTGEGAVVETPLDWGWLSG